MRLRSVVALVAVCELLAWFEPGTAYGYCRLTTEMPVAGEDCATEGVELYWARQCLSYSVVPRDEPEPPTETLRDVVDASFSAWTEVTCDGAPIGLEVLQTADTATCLEPEYNPDGPNANTVIFLDDWLERGLPGSAFGLTLVWHHPETGEIFDADVQINETLGTLAVCDGTCPRRSREVDIQNVVTHEAGHYFGLGHTDVAEATMSARATLGETSKRSLEEDDRNGLCAIYGDLASPVCMPLDFDPDNGFGPSCYFAEVDQGCGCRAPGTASGAPRGAALFAVLLVWVMRARRGRVAASSSTPSPKKR